MMWLEVTWLLEVCLLSAFAVLFYVFRDRSRCVMLMAASLSSCNAILWPNDIFGGYSYALDSMLYVIAAHFVWIRNLSLVLLIASMFNFLVLSAEIILTSSSFALGDGAIMILGLFYEHYELVMVLLTLAMLWTSLNSGLDIFMDDYERRDTLVRHNLQGEVPK